MFTQPKISESDRYRPILAGLLHIAGIAIDGVQPWDIRVRNHAFYRRVLSQGSLGLGESYMDGWWECERLDMFFDRLLRAGIDKTVKLRFRDGARVLRAKLFNQQNRRKAREVGRKHYDLGNLLFEKMLDPYLQYSCGYWKDSDNLIDAQKAKLDLICRKLQLKPGLRVLDIGCGWGGLAKYAAEHFDVSIVGITISKAQATKAEEFTRNLNVDIRLQDYRDLDEKFDRIVSVGMFEHVGQKNFRVFFRKASRCLEKNGLFLLHTIGSNHSAKITDPWITRYIFPNGYLPSVKQIAETSESLFVMEDWHNFGPDYDKTLMSWLHNFQQAWSDIQKQYDERFYRMFSYYLQCCAGGFRSRQLQLWQILFSPTGIPGGVRVPR